MVSLNDCPETRRLYAGWQIDSLAVTYSVGRTADRNPFRHCPANFPDSFFHFGHVMLLDAKFFRQFLLRDSFPHPQPAKPTSP